MVIDNDCDLNAKGFTSVKEAFCHNKGLWYSLSISTRHYSSNLALFPQLMPRGIDLVPLSDTFVLLGDATESGVNTVWQKNLLSHSQRSFHECLSVIQLEWLLISNMLVVNCIIHCHFLCLWNLKHQFSQKWLPVYHSNSAEKCLSMTPVTTLCLKINVFDSGEQMHAPHKDFM